METVENMKEISNFEIFKSKRKAGADMIDAYFKQGDNYVSSYIYGMKRRMQTDVKRESRSQDIPYLKFSYPFNKYNLIP